MPTQSMSRGRFLQEYDLGFDREFEHNGKAADWAPAFSGPSFWGSEDVCLQLPSTDPKKANVANAAMATTPDQRFLAVSTNAVLRIYEPVTQTQHAELVGHSANIWKLYFVPGYTSPAGPAYLLLSYGATVGGGEGEIILWYLDSEGRSVSRTMPFAIGALTDKAMAAVEKDLKVHHDLPESELSAIRDGFMEVLKEADTRNRVQNLPTMKGKSPSYVEDVASSDGKAVLYIDHSRTTQSGMRPPDELPQIVVLDLTRRTERCRMKGHTDTIIWAAWSPDSTLIATASWDQTYKIWDAVTGECRLTIGPTEGQNWAGAFSPDGKHVLLSGGSPTKVAIHSVETGEEVAVFKVPVKDGIKHWVRQIAWHPSDPNQIALVVEGQSLYLWHPFGDSSEGKVENILKLKSDGSMLDRFCSLHDVKWVDGGKKLAIETSENSVLLWEPERNIKWRFQRPKGTKVDTGSGDTVVLGQRDGKEEWVVSLDGDWRVRMWKL